MLICNLKPEDVNVCLDCMDTQIRVDECKSCLMCEHSCAKEEHILLSVGTTIFGKDYAIVTYGPNRSVKKVPLHRVMGVREKQ